MKDSEKRKNELEVEIEKVVKAQKDAQSAAEIAEREGNKLHTTKKAGQRTARVVRVAKVEAELQKICDDILALLDKNLIPSARRIAGAEGHQQRTPKRSSSLSKSILNRSQRSDRLARTTRTFRSRVVHPRTHSTT